MKDLEENNAPRNDTSLQMVVETCYSCGSNIGESKDTTFHWEKSIMVLYAITFEFQLPFLNLPEPFVQTVQ